MIPTEQSLLGPPEGDCLRACVASVLELPIEDLPNPHGEGWFGEWLDWLEGRGLTFVYCEPAFHFRGYWIACVQSPRGWDHAVVYRGEEMVWDPHPFRGRVPLGKPKDSLLLVPLDPAPVA